MTAKVLKLRPSRSDILREYADAIDAGKLEGDVLVVSEYDILFFAKASDGPEPLFLRERSVFALQLALQSVIERYCALTPGDEDY